MPEASSTTGTTTEDHAARRALRVAAVVAALAVTAWGARGDHGRAGMTVGVGVARAVEWTAAILVGSFVAVTAVALLTAWSPQRRRDSGLPRVFPAPTVTLAEGLVLVGVVLGVLAGCAALLVGVASTSSPAHVSTSNAHASARVGTHRAHAAGRAHGGGVAWSWLAAAAGGTATVATTIWLLVPARRGPRGDVEETPPLPRPEATGMSLDDLRGLADARLAVLGAYAHMEQLLGARGMARRDHEAPFEYLRRIRGPSDVPAAPATRLTELYETARFGHRPIGRPARDDALDALDAIITRVERS